MLSDRAEEDLGREFVGGGLAEADEWGGVLWRWADGFMGGGREVRVEDVDEEVAVLDADHGAWWWRVLWSRMGWRWGW